jgi:hypothetical protein
MDTDYNGHTIQILTDEVHGRWTFRALVFVPDDASQAVKRFRYDGSHFQTKDEAGGEGVLLVKEWIENGMPDRH